ncbi:MAG: DUF2752 domain-containing protein [Hydrogenoanaerobacterium sp.]
MKKRVIIVLAICAALFLGAALLFISPQGGTGIPCMVHFFTGFYCAGCGASRALRSVLHLQFYRAFRYNPLLVVLLPFIAVYFIARIIDYIKTGGNHIDARLSFKALLIVAVLIVVYSVLRNLPFYPFTLLVPTVLP